MYLSIITGDRDETEPSNLDIEVALVEQLEQTQPGSPPHAPLGDQPDDTHS